MKQFDQGQGIVDPKDKTEAKKGTQ